MKNMVGTLKSLQSSLHAFPSTNSMKLKTILHSHIFQNLWQVLSTLTNMKTTLMQLVTKDSAVKRMKMKAKKKNKKKFFSAITMHYNWCSNYVTPMPESGRHDYYDSTWNTILPGEVNSQEGLDSQLSGYLEWLEEKVPGECREGDVDEIDRLADKFIANCHEKFRLEKQESYRRYQEMLARSM